MRIKLLLTACLFVLTANAHADRRFSDGATVDYTFSIVPDRGIGSTGQPDDYQFGHNKYFDGAMDLMVRIVLKKAKSKSRRRLDADIERITDGTGMDYGLGLSRHKIMLKAKYRF